LNYLIDNIVYREFSFLLPSVLVWVVMIFVEDFCQFTEGLGFGYNLLLITYNL